MLEGHRLFALFDQRFVEYVEALQHRHFGIHIVHRIADECSLVPGTFLPPDFQRQFHNLSIFCRTTYSSSGWDERSEIPAALSTAREDCQAPHTPMPRRRKSARRRAVLRLRESDIPR